MRRLFTILSILSLVCSAKVSGQAIDKSLAEKGLAENAFQEKMYVHYNTPLIFPGEYFLYSIYSLQNGSGLASNFSKIAYVEMIGEGNEVIFRQKVKLEDGRGSADFFIPTNTPSGSYKLIAYTNWMKNLKNAIFEGDLVVINPYQGNQNKLLGATSTSTLNTSSTSGSIDEDLKNSKASFELKLNRTNFLNREKVQITFNGVEADAAQGRYSLSVRKIGGLPVPKRNYSESVVSPTLPVTKKSSGKIFLPELRGQLVSGRLISEDKKADVQDQKVVLSIPSSEGFVEIAITNKDGQFFFNLDRDLRDENAILEVLGDVAGNFDVQLNKNESVELDNAEFADYIITPEMEEEILERSLYNQVENAYFSVKPDTLAPVKEEIIFPNNIVATYNLDDYTRFKGVPDTFVEIIKSAWVKKEGKNKRVIEVRGLLGHLPMGLKSLVMVDGMMVQDHSDLLNYDARRIQTIKVIRDKIYLGPEIFQGAVLVETVEGDFPEIYAAPTAEKVQLVHPEVSKRYFQQVYSEETRNNRIPDYRYQLLWNPSLKLNQNETVQFFTSDVDGTFEVVLEGFTASGKPVSMYKTFNVE